MIRLLRGTGQEHGGVSGNPSSVCWKYSTYFYTRMGPLFLCDPHVANCPAFLTPPTLFLPWSQYLTYPDRNPCADSGHCCGASARDQGSF